MGAALTRLTHHQSRHVHREIVIPVVTVDTTTHNPPAAENNSSTNKHTPPPPPPPRRKPSLQPTTVPEAIVAATERGMVAENMVCPGGLPSPSPVTLKNQQSHSARDEYSYFPYLQIDNGRAASLESGESQRHESEARDAVVLTRGEEACGGEGRKGSWCVGRSVRWKGVDV